jgi:hypothetical protein
MNQYQRLIRNSIFIDFEGEGLKKDKTTPLPHMVGVFRPNDSGRSGKYQATFFREQWHPAANGSGGKATECEFEDFFKSLLLELKQHSKLCIFWSIHELVVLKLYLPASLFNELSKYMFNLLPDVRRYASIRRYRKLDSGEKAHSLDEYFQLYFKKRKPYPPISPGPAATCRRIDLACTRNKKWKKFSDRQKAYVKDLLAYNEGDVRCTWLLALKVANAQKLRLSEYQSSFLNRGF